VKINSYLIFLILFFVSNHRAFAISLKDRIEWELKAPGHQVTAQVQEEISSHHLVLVSGVMNEFASLVSSYFTDGIRAVESLGMDHTSVDPPSSIEVSRNADRLYSKIMGRRLAFWSSDRLGIYREHGSKPLVLMGHSKGGAETLLMILRHPELILEGIVDRVVILQGAIGGSPLAEPQNQSFLSQAVASFFQPGFGSLEPQRMQSLFQASLERSLESGLWGASRRMRVESEILLNQIKDRIFYVLADKTDGRIGPGISLVLSVVGQNLDHLGPNDGLVLLKDQVLKSRSAPLALGRVLARLPVDHLGTTVRYFSSTDSRYQEAFMVSCLAHVFDSKIPMDEDSEAVDMINRQSQELGNLFH